jgi:ribosomal protein S18 acetylase RimI-like enzyme
VHISIEPLSEENLDSFLYFFDEIGFSDNPDWAHCYCAFFHHHKDEADWLSKTKSENRKTAIRLIKTGTMKGVLAFHDSKPVAWCNVNKKSVFSFNKGRNEVIGPLDDKTLSIVCFLVAPEYRRKGVSNTLLKHVIGYFKTSDYQFLEAYPSLHTKLDSENYHGPLHLYQNHQFRIIRQFHDYCVLRYSG